ncbi:hypothetical protein AAF712_004852 [Marasmius tenuissimus]|uniref:Uncharacterized protein n=1 Tax=Marasmius tenuissimus TaxID=585030 RepID=A0ABR3A2J3_9AGAR
MNERHTQPSSWAGHSPLSWAEHCAPLTRILRLMQNDFSSIATLAFGYIETFGRHYVAIDTRSFDFVSIAPDIISLAKSDLHRFIDKQAVIDLFIWFDKGLDHRYLEDPYTLIDALDMLRVHQGLQKGCFTRPRGYFPVSMACLNDLLRGASTEGLAWELMEGYRQAFRVDATELSLSGLLLWHLVSYLFLNIPTDDLEKFPPDLRKEIDEFRFKTSELSDGMPHLLTSQEGLSFLQSLHATIIRNYRYSHTAADPWDPFPRWELGLKCVAHLNKLPLDYFDVRDSSQHPHGTSEAGPSGVILNAPPPERNFDGGNGLTGDGGEDPLTPAVDSGNGATGNGREESSTPLVHRLQQRKG